MVSFYEPHSPYRFPLEYRGRHDPAEFAVPRLGPGGRTTQIPAIFRDLTDAEKQGIAAAYYTQRRVHGRLRGPRARRARRGGPGR